LKREKFEKESQEKQRKRFFFGGKKEIIGEIEE